jgi:hypothetical protein
MAERLLAAMEAFPTVREFLLTEHETQRGKREKRGKEARESKPSTDEDPYVGW